MKMKILSVMLTLLLVLNLVPVMAFAEGGAFERFSPDDLIPGGQDGTQATGLVDKAFGVTTPAIRTFPGGSIDAFLLGKSEIADAKKPDLSCITTDNIIKGDDAQSIKISGFGSGALFDKALLGNASKINNDKLSTSDKGSEVVFDKDISTFDELVTLFRDGGNGRLVENITADGVLIVEKDVKLSLNGCVLDLASLGNILVGNGVNFDLYDNGDAVHYFTPDDNGLWIWDNTDTDGAETLTGGVICGGSSAYGGAVDIDGGAFTMHGGNIAGCMSYYGGAVNVQGGSFTMDGGKIIGNNALNYGAGVNVYGSSFTMKNGEISSNNTYFGGGVFIYAGVFTMEDGVICKNSAEKSGGAVYVYNSSFEMNGGTICENEAQAGGAVFIDSGSLTIKNGEISKNYSEYGGAVCNCYGILKMEGGLFCGNVANFGGAVYNENASFTMTDGEISGNEALQGGAVLMAIGTFTLKGGMLNGNSANFGAAVLNLDKFIIDGGEITSNTAGKSGGAVYNQGVLTMNDGEINGNIAPAGGAVFTDGGTFTLNDGEIICNKADQGGAVFVNSGVFNMNGGKLGGNVAGAGGAVAVGEPAKFTLSGGKLCDNTSDYGGAVLNAGEFTIDSGEINFNSATYSGGAVYNQGTLTINNCTITGNSSYYGGAVFNETGNFTMKDGIINYNMANYGGGVFIESGSFTMKNGNIKDNSAVYGGGVLVNEGSFIMEDGELSGNSATNGGGVETEVGTFTMKGGILTANDSYCGGAVLNFGGFTFENGEISGNTSVYGGAIYNYKGVVNLTAAPGKQISITGNDVTDTYGAILNAGTLKLSGKVIIKDNTAANGMNNIGVSDPVFIVGALTGSEIYIAHADFDDEYDAGVLTVDYSKNNPGAKSDDFFKYDGSADLSIILNSDGELEIVDQATLLAMAKEDAIRAVNTAVPENAPDEIKAVVQKAVEDITNAEDLTAVNNIKTSAIKEIETLKAEICDYCGKIHPNNFWGNIAKFFHNMFYLIKNLFKIK